MRIELQEVQRHGDELEAQLKALAGMKNNNPRRAPGVPYTKWQPAYIPCNSAKTLREKSKWFCHLRLCFLFVIELAI